MRRLVPTTVLLMALLLAAVAAAPGVVAHDTAEHPAIGTWIIDTSPALPLRLVTSIRRLTAMNRSPTPA